MLNYIWAFLIISGLLVAGLLGRITGDSGVIKLALDGSDKAITLALGLVGIMTFWMGTLRLLEKAGILDLLARLLAPVLSRLFPDVPKGHAALHAIIMNWTANMLGLGNMATPMGLKAMSQLQELNPHKQHASNSMATFLALNTGAFTLIPMTVINYMNAAGMKDSQQIILPTILASLCATIAAVCAAKLLQGLPMFAIRPEDIVAAETAAQGETAASASSGRVGGMGKVALWALAIAFIGIAILEIGPKEWRGELLQTTGIQALVDNAAKSKAPAATPAPSTISNPPPTIPLPPEPVWRRTMNGVSGMAIPAILLLAIGLSLAKGAKVYEEFIEGAKEGFATAIRIMPFLVAMFAALAIFRGSGMLMLLQAWLSPALAYIGFPADLLPLALMRPLSGSGASAILNEILAQPDISSVVKYTAGILYGSTETTFYVIAVYFGSVGIRRVRHALAAGLCADFIGMVAAVVIGRLMF